MKTLGGGGGGEGIRGVLTIIGAVVAEGKVAVDEVWMT